jgi:hypothetical protein
MSAEVLANEVHRIYVGMEELPRFCHDAVHDMESFLWVLVEICLTRKGPGLGMRRDELKPGENLQHGLNDSVHKLFDADPSTLLRTKSDMLVHLKSMDEEIIPLFHPYFEQLKPMVLQWWHILRLAYRFRAFEYYNIHVHIIDVLEQSISRLLNDDNDDSRREIERRIRDRRLVREIFKQKNEAAKTGKVSQVFETSPDNPDLGLKMAPLVVVPDSPTPMTKKRRKSALMRN